MLPKLTARQERGRGSVLVICVWIVTILVLLAISIGRRASFESRILRYHLSRAQAYYLAKSASERAYLEKAADKNVDYDYLQEDWSNKLNADGNPEFKDFPLGSGTFTIKYSYPKSEEPLYGMQDEQSKININAIVDSTGNEIKERRDEFVRLLECLGYDAELADKFIDWIDSDDDGPYEERYYSGQGIKPKNSGLDRLEELIMIDGFTQEIYDALSPYLTVYTKGEINVNTAPEEVLLALGFNSNDEVPAILNYRADGDVIKEIISSPATCSFLSTDGKLCLSASKVESSRLSSKSEIFKANSSGTVNNVTKRVTSVVEIKSGNAPKQLYWYEE